MNNRRRLAFFVIVCVSMIATLRVVPTEPAEVVDPRRASARTVSAEFGAELKAALERALAERGPVEAIAVCKEEAPRIAARFARQTGASVARTGVRVRNPANAPQPWQRTVLESFEKQLAAGAKPEELEHFELHADGSAHYLRAIVTQPVCLVCHGETLSPDVQAAVDELYPHDQATGFRLGDLRGAFVIEWVPEGNRGQN
jgi:hypothetical protein